MANVCAGCGKEYGNDSLELEKGCECGSTVFIYRRGERAKIKETKEKEGEELEGKKPLVDIPEGAAPGPAAFEPPTESEGSETPQVDPDEIREGVEEKMEDIAEGRTEEARKGEIRFDMESIRVLEEGVYDINLGKLIQKEPLIVEVREDGNYLVHLASVFRRALSMDEGVLDEAHQEVAEEQRIERLLERSIPDVKEELEGMDDPDYSAVLEMEREGKDRKTLKKWLRSRIGGS